MEEKDPRKISPAMKAGYYIVAAFLLIILSIVIGTIYWALDIPPSMAIALLIATLAGSFLNVPVKKIGQQHVHLNIGGCIIPVLLSGYFILQYNQSILEISMGVLLMSLITFKISNIVPERGIEMPILVPPISALILGFVLPGPIVPIAYASGTMGTLIGADILNLDNIDQIGLPVLSIGGAGTFDGIFLTGIAILFLGLI